MEMTVDLFCQALLDYKDVNQIKFEVSGVTDSQTWSKEEQTCLAESVKKAVKTLEKQTGVTDRSKMQLIFNNKLETRVTQWLGHRSHFQTGPDRIWGIEFEYNNNISGGEILLRE